MCVCLYIGENRQLTRLPSTFRAIAHFCARRGQWVGVYKVYSVLASRDKGVRVFLPGDGTEEGAEGEGCG